MAQLLKEEVETYRSYLSNFSDEYNKYRCTTSRSGYVNPRDYNQAVCISYEHPYLYDNIEIHRGSTSFTSCANHQQNFEYLEFHRLINEYKRRSLNSNKIKHMNENLNYILSLIEVLQYELTDLKKNFTTYLNINLVFGAAGTSIALTAVISSSSLFSILLSAIIGGAGVVPLFYTLGIGALSEISLSSIYKPLLPLLVNELGLLELQLQKRMLKICNNLVKSESRSYIILGKFALNFGSITSVSRKS